MWTNSTLRKHLGERGFFQEGPPIFEDEVQRKTRWHRDGEEIVLVEWLDGGYEPGLFFNDKDMNPHEIGWRNVNTQTGNTGPA